MRRLLAEPMVEDYRVRLLQAVQTLNQHECRPTVAIATLDKGPPLEGETDSQLDIEARCHSFLSFGIQVHQQPVPRTGAVRALAEQLRIWSGESRIHGIMLAPDLVEAYAEHELPLKIAPEKDIGCLHPVTRDRGAFAPPLVSALSALLAHYELTLRGRHIALVCADLQETPSDPSGWLGPRRGVLASVVDFMLSRGGSLSVLTGPAPNRRAVLSLSDSIFILESPGYALAPSDLPSGSLVVDLRPPGRALQAHDLAFVARDFAGPSEGWLELEQLMWVRNLVEVSRLRHLEGLKARRV
jgi:hypothetical protein